jgi:hypothetical protein
MIICCATYNNNTNTKILNMSEPFKGVSKFKMMKVGNSTLGWTLNDFFWNSWKRIRGMKQ